MTIFMPVTKRAEIVFNEIDIENGNKIINDSKDYQETIFKFFLTDYELREVQKYAPRCFYYQDGIAYGVLGYDILNGEITSQSNAKIELLENDSLIDLNEVNITITTDYTHFYHLQE